jgi:Transglutaminase-like superfamily
MRKTWNTLRTVFILIFLFQSLLPVSFGQEIQGIPSSLKSPQDVERWLSNFTYQMKIPDAPQTVEETLGSKAGDCDDLAKVVSKALAGLGISSDVVVVKTKGVKIRHAICVWKDENGSYDFSSNQQLIHTGEKNMEVAIQKHFRLYESISILTPE